MIQHFIILLAGSQCGMCVLSYAALQRPLYKVTFQIRSATVFRDTLQWKAETEKPHCERESPILYRPLIDIQTWGSTSFIAGLPQQKLSAVRLGEGHTSRSTHTMCREMWVRRGVQPPHPHPTKQWCGTLNDPKIKLKVVWKPTY